MQLYTIDIHWRNNGSRVGQLVCTFNDLENIVYILDDCDFVLEYKISTGSRGEFTKNLFNYECVKLVTKFDWNK